MHVASVGPPDDAHMLDADTAADAAVVTTLLSLPFDSLAHVASVVDVDDLFSFALSCRLINQARGSSPLKTSLVSTLRSPALRAWADALGCPSPYPHWARLHGLKKEEWNDRYVTVAGPPNQNGRHPVHVDADIKRQRMHLTRAAQGGPLRWPGDSALIRTENIAPLGAHEVARVRVLLLDAMLPGQKLRVTRTAHEGLTEGLFTAHARLFDSLLELCTEHARVDKMLPMRMCVVGFEPAAEGARAGALPYGVELDINVHVEVDPANAEHHDVKVVTLTAGRPCALLELLNVDERADGARVLSERDPQRVWATIGEARTNPFFSRVRWQTFGTGGDPPPSGLERRTRETFREWGACVRRNGYERFEGQLEQILDDLGTCPCADAPEAVCMWLAALLNPLPALGVAPEIRGHVMGDEHWSVRFDAVQKGVEASLRTVSTPSARPGTVAAQRAGEAAQEVRDIDVCRVS